MDAKTLALPAFPSAMRKAPRLRAGDRVGLISPASPLGETEIERGIEHVRCLGLEPVLGHFAAARNGYLAGSDAERAGDFNRMARDPEIRGIIALRGGYGTMRILELLDYAAIAADPKVVMGFSDLTAVLNAVARRCAVVTFHGPLAAGESPFDAKTREYVERACMSAEPIGTLRASNAVALHPGRARGRIAGGNLSLVASLVGTPWAPAFAEVLLVLEEIGEEPYRIDRMLTQLRLAGALKASRGILFGACSECEAKGPSSTVDQILADRLGDHDGPVLAGVPVGHVPEQWVLPIGLDGVLDASNLTLEIPEAAVRTV
ncbi:MAG TPA: LD-carboxypeptidase [Candidatus Tyrphobacter sp.]